METPNEKYLIPSQVTMRFTDEEKEFINENITFLVGDDLDITRNKLFVKALTLAVSKSTPKEVVKDNPNQQKIIDAQAQKIIELENDNLTLTGNLEKANSDLSTKQDLPKDAIVLNLDMTDRQYFWGVLQLLKKENKVQTYEELLKYIFTVFHARGEFKLTKEDLEYLQTLEYDGTTEAPAGE